MLMMVMMMMMMTMICGCSVWLQAIAVGPVGPSPSLTVVEVAWYVRLSQAWLNLCCESCVYQWCLSVRSVWAVSEAVDGWTWTKIAIQHWMRPMFLSRLG